MAQLQTTRVSGCFANKSSWQAWQGPVPVRPGTRRGLPCHAAFGSKKPDKVMEGLKELAGYVAPTVAAITGMEAQTRPAGTTTRKEEAVLKDDWRSPVYALIAVLVAVHLLSSLVPVQGLFLGLGAKFRLWQLLTSAFVHSGPMHLAESVFMVYTFGRLLERSHGAWALWTTYLASALGANLMAVWLLPATRASAGLAMSAASAATLGLFVAGLVWRRVGRKPLEVGVLAPWVFGATCARYAALASVLVVDGRAAGHMAHMLGAVLSASLMAGALRVLELVQEALEEQRSEQLRLEAEKKRAQRNTNDSQAVADVLGTAAKAASMIAKKLL